MSIDVVNDLSQELVKLDFSNGHAANQGGPTKTSRAMALIHLAAHDAFARVTGLFAPRLAGLPDPPAGSGTDDAAGSVALLGAGFVAAGHLYPDFYGIVDARRAASTVGADPALLAYGASVGEAWIVARREDGSQLSQEDRDFSDQPGHHRPDPFNPRQTTLGRKWGTVTPFVIGSVASDAPLGPPPDLATGEYALAYDQVFEEGRVDNTDRSAESEHMAVVGIFWGYDGSNLLGTPPRLYNQVVRAIEGVKTLPHARRVRLLTAVNAAMADAGIAAWHWKYEYDFWRPIVGIREADPGWGPTGAGDGNTLRSHRGDPFCRPLGAPRSNPFPGPVDGAAGSNGTPNFPAYPSGHATFGTACFETAAALLGKAPEQVTVKFASDEFNGITTDNQGVARPRWEPTFTLRRAIEENKVSGSSSGSTGSSTPTAARPSARRSPIAPRKSSPSPDPPAGWQGPAALRNPGHPSSVREEIHGLFPGVVSCPPAARRPGWERKSRALGKECVCRGRFGRT